MIAIVILIFAAAAGFAVVVIAAVLVLIGMPSAKAPEAPASRLVHSPVRPSAGSRSTS